MSYVRNLIFGLIFFLLNSISIFSITLIVTSSEDDEFAYAWDDGDTENTDESMDGICRDEKGRCTLRAAIEELNNIGNGGTVIIDVDRIQFDGIQCDSYFEIKPSGTSKPVIVVGMGGAFTLGDNSKITGIKFEISGYAIGIGLASNCIAENLDFVGDGASSAVAIDGSNTIVDSVTIAGSFIAGIAISGEESKNNIIKNSTIGSIGGSPNGFGIMVNGVENIVENCVVIGNGLAGISIGGFGELNSVRNIVRNNFVGCNREFSKAGNGEGIQVISNNNKIENNYVGWNTQNGIYLNSVDEQELGTVSFNTIKGNQIGGVKDTEILMPNEHNGILLLGSVKDNTIGSDMSADNQPNYIANNKRYGIYCQKIQGNNPEKNAFRKNIITNNIDLGIKNENETQQNIKPPMFDSLVNGIIYGHGGISGSKIDIYENDLDLSGSGEAKKWIMEFSVNSELYQIPIGELPENGISATVTNQTNSTSEFSCNVPSIMEFSKQLDVTFFDKISDKDDNLHTVVFYPARSITEAKYKINEKPWTPAQISGNTAKFTVNMGSDFKIGQNDLLFSSISCNGFVDTMIFHPYIVKVPEFAAPAGDYTTQRSDPELKYFKGKDIEWPNPNLNVSVNIPDVVPYVGGSWGLKETGLKFPMVVSSLGTEIPQDVEVKGGFGLGEKQYDITGEGNVTNSLLPSGLKTDGTITANLPIKLWEKEENLLTVIPTTQTLCELPLGAELCAFLNGLVHAGIRSSITLDLGGNADFGAGEILEWQSGELISSLTLSVVASANLSGIAGFTVEGSGTGTLNIPFPGLNPSVSGSLDFTAFGQIAGVGSISGNKSWMLGGGIINKESNNPVVLKNQLKADSEYNIISSDAPFDANSESCLFGENSVAVVWAETNGEINSSARDIKLAVLKDGTLDKTVNITNNNKNNHNPRVVSQINNRIVVVWESNELPELGLDKININDYVKNAGISYSILNSNDFSIISSGYVDIDNAFDFAPDLLSSGNDINLVWTKTDGYTIVGKSGNKAVIMHSKLEGNSFTEPFELLSDEGIVHKSVTSTNLGNVVIAYEKDFDGNLETINDREIMLYDQSLSSNQLKQITTNNEPDMMPVVAVSEGFKINIAYTDLTSVTYIENMGISSPKKIYSGETGLNFSNAQLIHNDKISHLVWSSTRGFNSLTQDISGNWSNILKTEEYNYVNILHKAMLISDGSVMAVFQKFDNRESNVLLMKNELVNKKLNFLDVNTNVNINLKNSNKLTVFPNPAESTIYLINAGSRIEIYNSIGICVQKINDYHESTLISIENLPTGIYLIKSGNQTVKFIKS